MSPAVRWLVTFTGLLASTIGAGARAADKPSYNSHTGLFEAPFSELQRAVERKDRADVARWAMRIGPARLSEALRGSDRPRVLAALEGVSALPGNVRLLDAAVPLVLSRDAAIAERAARLVGRMLDSSEPRKLEDWDVPLDVVVRACAALSETALKAGSPVETRLVAVEALAESASCKPPLVTLLTDALPQLRRAALLSFHPTDEMPGPVLRQAGSDREPQVASAAAVLWCRRRALGRPVDERPPVALRDVVNAEGTPLEDVLELLPCLAASKDSADRRALEQLRHSKTPTLRARATELASAPSR